MRVLYWVLLTGVVFLAVAPAMAQRYDPRYPVCLQSWHQHGLVVINCSYTSIDQCRMTASGLSATCLENPYWRGWPNQNSQRRPYGVN